MTYLNFKIIVFGILLILMQATNFLYSMDYEYGQLSTYVQSEEYDYYKEYVSAKKPQIQAVETLELDNCQNLGGKVLEEILEHFHNLKCIKLFAYTGEYGIKKDTEKSYTRKTPAEIISIAQNTNDLKNLILIDCGKITDKALAIIAQNNPDLTSLFLYSCFNITDRGLIFIACSCPKLQELSLHYCGKITRKSLDMLARECKNLHSIEIR